MPTTEEAAAPSAEAGDDTQGVAVAAVSVPPAVVPPAAGGKKRKAVPMRTAAGGAAAAAVTVRSTRKTAKTQHNHPPYGSMIKAALQAMQEKKGSSRAAILKYIMQNYEVGENPTLVNAHLRMGLKRGVASGTLKQMKGTGASGSFRLADAKMEPVKKAKKPATKKTVAAGDVKTPAPKKSSKPRAATKKTTAPMKATKPRAAPKKKTVSTSAAATGGGGGEGVAAAAKRSRRAGGTGGAKKAKRVSAGAKPTMAKKPATAAHGRSKKIAAA